MLTGLVYAAVVVLWAVVLVPQWLRRHERNSEHHTTLTFHRAMRTLERRRSTRGISRASHDVDVVVAGARSRVHDRVTVDAKDHSAIDLHLDYGIDPFVGGVEEVHLRDARRLRAQVHARRTAARRRRQVQQLLFGTSLISVVLTFMGVLPPSIGALAPVATGLFWYAARRQVVASEVMAARRARRDAMVSEQREMKLDQEGSAGRATAPQGRSGKQSGKPQKNRRAARRHVETTAPSSAATRSDYAAADAGGTDVRMLSSDEVATRRVTAAQGGWEPVEPPLPGPVNDSSPTPSDRSSQRMLEQAEALREPGADAEAELGLDAFVDVSGAAARLRDYQDRRAVND